MKRALALGLLLALALASAAYPIGFGKEGAHFGREGSNGSKKAVAASCASPTAPNGVVDLSVCSNAFYVAVIF